jgi:hypothetical protein
VVSTNVFALVWTLSALVGTVVYVWDAWQAIGDELYLDHPLPGLVERRRVRSRRVIAANKRWGSSLIAAAELVFLCVGLLALAVPSPHAPLTMRGVIYLTGFVGAQVCISVRGVVLIVLRWKLRVAQREEMAAALRRMQPDDRGDRT